MANSQNGWPVVDRDQVTDRAVHGVEFPNGWLKGDVDVVFTYLIARLNGEVEAIDDGGCWGWFVKVIEGSSTISNHASGTAIDYNAPAHPMGSRNTYSAADQAKIRAILADLSGVVRWGGDYTGRPDDMHFEINKGRSAVKAVADRIRAQEDDMDQETFTKYLGVALAKPTPQQALKLANHDTEIGRTGIKFGAALGTILARSADDLDEAEVARLVLAGLPAAELVKAMTDAQAEATADLLAARLQS